MAIGVSGVRGGHATPPVAVEYDTVTEPAPTLPRKAEAKTVLAQLLSHKSVTHSHVVSVKNLKITARLQ